MSQYFESTLFGVTITIIAFFIGKYINQKTKKAILNPILISVFLIILFLKKYNIDYETYNKGGSIISFFIAPATVVLAVPLYKNIKLLKGRWVPITVGIIIGSLAGLVTIFVLCKIFRIEDIIMISMFPKSTTAAISMEIADSIGGLPNLAAFFTAISGISGNILGEYVFNIFKIKSRIAKGVAFGTSSHALGTAKAMEMGEAEGALSSLSITVAGIISVFLIPWFMNIIGI